MNFTRVSEYCRNLQSRGLIMAERKMYYPYIRGNQFDLVAIQETAGLLANAKFVPVIEPLRHSLSGLEKALEAICGVQGSAIVVVSPSLGDPCLGENEFKKFLDDNYSGVDSIRAGILLSEKMKLSEAVSNFETLEKLRPVFIHAGFSDPKGLAEHFSDEMPNLCNIFIENYAQMRYSKHFEDSERVLVRNGFQQKRFSDFPPIEVYSELHETYPELGMDGFGDFLVDGEYFNEPDGPAYSVSIHVTYIDCERDDVMYICHFVSDDRDTPSDPSVKFGQALDKLMEKLEGGNSQISETSAMQEFRKLHSARNFPGLGYVKKLSMKHHIETLIGYLD